mgnify:FL=1
MTQIVNTRVCLSEPLLRLAAEIAPYWGVSCEDLITSNNQTSLRARRAWYLVIAERYGWTYGELARVLNRDATATETQLNRARVERNGTRYTWPWGAMFEAGITGWIRGGE